ncbi:MAG: RNA methyltransferase [Balneolaceae bacterium]|nr:RNA methyltransferase [Balneolaceae bacterium]
MSSTDELIAHLRTFVTDERWERLNEVLSQRTRRLTVVLEDIYQPHNASAVLRSCDCFGIQDVHIIENENRFTLSSEVTVGSDQWLTLERYRGEEDNTRRCLRHLREGGYRLVATTPHEEGEKETVDIDRLPLDRPIALLFGSELPGLTGRALEEADLCTRIPMLGFSESYNISVSAALSLYELSLRMRRTLPRDKWELPEQDRRGLLLRWLKTSLRAGEELAEKFLREREE